MTNNNSNPERFSTKSLFKAFIDTFDVNKGFIKTYRLLASKPGESIRNYLKGERSLLTKPLRLLLISTTLVAFFMFQVMPTSQFAKGFDQGFNSAVSEEKMKEIPEEKLKQNLEKKVELQPLMEDAMNKYFNVMMLLFLPFVSLCSFLFYKKRGYNFAEHFILNSYILSFQNLLYFLTLPLLFISFASNMVIYMVLYFVYYFYAFQRFFEMKFWPSFGRTLAAITLGYILYCIALMLLMMVLMVIVLKMD